MAEKSRLEVAATTIQVLSVVVGIVMSVLSFNSSRRIEAEARITEAEARITEAERPFQQLRQKIYVETAKTAGVIATPEGRSKEEIATAERRLKELYVVELSMVELPGVESAMIAFAQSVSPELVKLTKSQEAALNLSHALRDSYVAAPIKFAPPKQTQ